MKRFFYLIFLLSLLAISCKADVIQFKNGDQLTGKWEQVLHSGLKFNSDSVGEVTVPLNKLKSFSTSKPGVAVLKTNETVHGNFSFLPSGEWQFTSARGNKVLSTDAAEAIYPQDVYERRSLERTVMPWKNWHGASTVGATLVRGDRKATLISLGMHATHKSPDLPGLTEHWRTNFALNGLYSTTQSSPHNRVTNNSISSGLRQDLLLRPTISCLPWLRWNIFRRKTSTFGRRTAPGSEGTSNEVLRPSSVFLGAPQ